MHERIASKADRGQAFVPRSRFEPMMSAAQERFLNLRRLPGFLTIEQATLLTGLTDTELGFLAKRGILCPAGQPKPKIKRLYCTAEVQAFLSDADACNAARDACVEEWELKNRTRAHKQPVVKTHG